MVKQVRCLNGDSEIDTSTDSLISYFESLEDCRYAVLYNESIPCGDDIDENSLIQHEVNDYGGKNCCCIISNYDEKEILENSTYFLEDLFNKSLFDDEKFIIIKKIKY